jgi:hypothetical protein
VSSTDVKKPLPPAIDPKKGGDETVYIVIADTNEGMRLLCAVYRSQQDAISHARRLQMPLEQLGGQAPAQLANIRNVGVTALNMKG